MSNGTEFHGDVGQVVMGNVVISSDRERLQPITEQQRMAISTKVKAVMSATGLERLEVYRIVLDQFAIPGIGDLPSAHYPAALTLLDSLLVAADASMSSTVPAQESASAAPCPMCAQAEKKARERVRIMKWIVVIVLWLCAVAIVLTVRQTNAATEGNDHCLLEGKQYSLGSMARMQNGQYRTCVQEGKGRPHWEQHYTAIQ